MKPATHVFLWLSELLALTVVYTLLCYFIPDEAFMAWYQENYGFIQEAHWNDGFSLILYFLAIAITTFAIWFIAAARQRKWKKSQGENT
ncbi:TPA: hypothetical protein R8G53_001098 [Citrobacter braakii]|uniref:hypothetical protein n=1 Tax=Citrobacter TaxID=544 RepID=UPI0015EAD073|nr:MULTISPECIES: hypothetical protein [Citrobacter]MDM3350628.1 hypothetical protein [Citrobacter sp. Cb007]QLR13053.1 hypothetical protein HV352_03125 [Citrobacter sp. RHBSTW-01044]HEE9990137.1 hypothetical protein [Citrobacter braakii]HEF0001023.1 hypothetical protein [Citrobacter braakii]HEF0031460.1 hypothetical protein [Citrobacter braakii]